MPNPEEAIAEHVFETPDVPIMATSDAAEENLASVQKFVAVGVGILMLCSMLCRQAYFIQ